MSGKVLLNDIYDNQFEKVCKIIHENRDRLLDMGIDECKVMMGSRNTACFVFYKRPVYLSGDYPDYKLELTQPMPCLKCIDSMSENINCLGLDLQYLKEYNDETKPKQICPNEKSVCEFAKFLRHDCDFQLGYLSWKFDCNFGDWGKSIHLENKFGWKNNGCFACNQVGHFKSDCPILKTQQKLDIWDKYTILRKYKCNKFNRYKRIFIFMRDPPSICTEDEDDYSDLQPDKVEESRKLNKERELIINKERELIILKRKRGDI